MLPRTMPWQPNVSSLTDTDAVTKGLLAAWPRAKRVEAVRLGGGRAPKMRLGEYTIESSDSAEGVIEELASQCHADSEALGGDERTYEVQVFLVRNTRKPDMQDLEMKVIGRLKFGNPEAVDRGGGGLLKEVSAIFKGYGEAQTQIAAADQKRLEAIGTGFDVMAKMLEGMGAITEQTAAVGANHVKMFELKVLDEKERRQEAREEAQAQAEIEYERERDARMLTLLGHLGNQAQTMLAQLLPTLIFKMRVDAEVKAKEHSVTVEAPNDAAPPTPPSSAPTVTQVEVTKTETRDELASLIGSLTAAEKKKIQKAAGEDIWSVLEAAAKAPDDDQCIAILMKLRELLTEMGPKAQPMLISIGTTLGMERVGKLQRVFRAVGINLGG